MVSFRPELESCPACGAGKRCHIHAYYGRSIIDFIHGRPVRSRISVLRLICDSCGHTHAVLPDILIPYSSYGILFVLRVLAELFSGTATVEQLCERFHITQNQLYKWKQTWYQHKQEWLGLLDSISTSDSAFLESLTIHMDFSWFASRFVLKCARSFLQSHCNPPPATP